MVAGCGARPAWPTTLNFEQRSAKTGMSARHSVFAAALDAIGKTGLDNLLAPLTRGVGVILTLHRVHSAPQRGFAPNRILEITPDFLDAALVSLKSLGYELVTL